MTSTATTTDIPGYRAGTWKIDTAHSEIGFSIRHIMISKVKGKCERFDAPFVTAEDPLDSRVTASAEVASITTNEPNRDAHLRTGDFFDATNYLGELTDSVQVDIDPENKFAYDFGAGVEFRLTGMSTFVEANWQSIQTEDVALRTIPIRVGIKF